MPKSIDEDASVTVRPMGQGRYEFSPFPFAGSELEVRCQGRYFEKLAPGDEPDDLAAHLFGLPGAEQVFTFTS